MNVVVRNSSLAVVIAAFVWLSSPPLWHKHDTDAMLHTMAVRPVGLVQHRPIFLPPIWTYHKTFH